ncbi:NAD(+) diphosphatase [Myxococcota bacterium]|nr:NAD(+) diphosphatase [Myxococcota bacterium]
MTQPILFSGSPIDRAEHQRREPEFVQEQLERDDARFVAMWRLNALIRTGDEPGVAWTRSVVREHMNPVVQEVFLGLSEGIPYFAVDISALENPAEVLGAAEVANFEDVRAAASRIPFEEASILAHARSRVDWHARHHFCPTCGGKTEPRGGGAHRVCLDCSVEHFPRVDPVAIAVVIHGDRCLLGRQRGWPEQMYSALAGFIDCGESLEEAVRREVAEEAGVPVGEVRYVASQPWPFAASLMIGCRAEALDDAVEIDRFELEDASWFERDVVRRALAGDVEGTGLIVPPPMAIANHLLHHWVDEG